MAGAVRASAWSGSAARSATSPPPRSTEHRSARHRRPGVRDHARGRSASWSRRSPRCQSPSAATCPGSSPAAGTSSSPRRWRSRPCSRSAASTGIEVTEASLRDGVFLARELLAGEEPLLRRRPRGRRAQPGDPVRVRHGPRRARRPAGAADVRLARRRRPVRARARRARAAVGRRDAPRRRDDDLLRRPPQALLLPDRQRRAARLRPARARADRPDCPLPPQGHAEARRDGAARRGRRRGAARALLR